MKLPHALDLMRKRPQIVRNLKVNKVSSITGLKFSEDVVRVKRNSWIKMNTAVAFFL